MRVITDTDFTVHIKLFKDKVPVKLCDVVTLTMFFYTTDNDNRLVYDLSDIDEDGNIEFDHLDVAGFDNGILYYKYNGQLNDGEDFGGYYETGFYIRNTREKSKGTCATALSELINDCGFVTGLYVQEKIEELTTEHVEEIVDEKMGDYAKASDVYSALNEKQNNLVSGTNIKTINGNSLLGSGNINVVTDLSNYYTKDYIDSSISRVYAAIPTRTSQLTNDSGYLTQHQSLSNYYTKSQVDTNLHAVEQRIPTVPTKLSMFSNDVGYVTAADIPVVTGFATKTYVDGSINIVKGMIPTVPTKLSAFSNDVGYLTQHQSLSNYTTKTYVDGSINSVRSSIPTKVSQLQNDRGYVTAADIPVVTGFATKEYVDGSINRVKALIPTVPTNVSSFINDAGYLTQHQSLTDYATKTYVDASIAIENSRALIAEAALENMIENVEEDIEGKQDVLVSGTNIKTINNQSILGSGNIDISAGTIDSSNYYTKSEIDGMKMIKYPSSTLIKDITYAGNNMVKQTFTYDSSGNWIQSVSLIDEASTTKNGLMAAGDKVKLNELWDSSTGANYYTKSEIDALIPPTASNSRLITRVDERDASTGKLRWSGIFRTDGHYSAISGNWPEASDASNGLMSSIDKAKLDALNDASANWLTREDASVYALKEELPYVPTNLSEFVNDVNFVNRTDVSIYATTDYVDTNVSDVSTFVNGRFNDYSTTTEMETAISEATENMVTSTTASGIVICTQDEYEAMETHVATVLYVIKAD